MVDAQRRIEALAQEFIDRLTEIAKQELLEVLGGGRRAPATRSTKPARSRGGGQKRSAKRLDQLQAKFHGFVAKHPGLRIEQINAKLGTKTSELQLPIRKLIASGQIKAKGSKRSTTYSTGAKARS